MTRVLVQLRRAMNWGRHAGPARLVLVAAAVLGIIAAVRPEVLTSQDPNAINAHAILVGPNWAHWLGTNEEGSDVLARIIYGTRLDLLLAVGSAGIAGLVGFPLGALAGYRGGVTDYVLQSFAISTLAFPLILFAVLIVASFGASLVTLIGILSFLFTAQVFTVARAQAKALREREFITAATVSGIRTTHLLRRHLFPNTRGPVLVLLPQLMATAIIAEAGLSYLGLGVQPPSITWGTILEASENYYQQQPYYAVAAGLVVTVSAGLLMFAGDVISESLDPRRRRAAAGGQPPGVRTAPSGAGPAPATKTAGPPGPTGSARGAASLSPVNVGLGGEGGGGS
jgi:peptide/nickel transport system permease protein